VNDVADAEGRRPVKRALVSVYDKTSVIELGQGLAQAGVEIVSTGTTAAVLAEAGVPVVKVEDVTGFPECLDGRVKTLHPKVHAGLLADTRNPAHLQQLDDLGVAPFDLVVCNLYPFRETVAKGAAPDAVVEQIDIGGPSMVRAAAKNHHSVAVVTSPARYMQVLDAVIDGGFSLAARKELAVEAFVHTASYDIAVASWLGNDYAPSDDSGFPGWIGASWQRAEVLRYGENPHQRAALYRAEHGALGLAQAKVLHGKAMSYNNYVDTDAARRAAYDFTQPCVAIIKHANPCGIAIGADIAEAHRKAHACDPVSAYGGVIATNRTVTAELAKQIAEVFTEVVCAPGFDDDALDILGQKKNLRLLLCAGTHPAHHVAEFRPISGGMLVQTVDDIESDGDDVANWQLKAGKAADDATLVDLEFAWRAVRSVKSNAILLAADGASVGVGMGQVNRVDSARLAVLRAGERAAGSVCASDAFFPFADGPQLLIDAGVRAIVEPGGSIRDDDVVAACEAAGITLYFTGARHFYH